MRQQRKYRRSYTKKRCVDTRRVSDAIVSDSNVIEKPVEEKTGFFSALLSVFSRFFK